MALLLPITSPLTATVATAISSVNTDRWRHSYRLEQSYYSTARQPSIVDSPHLHFAHDLWIFHRISW